MAFFDSVKRAFSSFGSKPGGQRKRKAGSDLRRPPKKLGTGVSVHNAANSLRSRADQLRRAEEEAMGVTRK